MFGSINDSGDAGLTKYVLVLGGPKPFTDPHVV